MSVTPRAEGLCAGASRVTFNTGTPLEYYVEAEARQAHAVLGCVGSKIVAQEFLEALMGTGNKFTEITPDPALEPTGDIGGFTFQDLLIDDQLTPKVATLGPLSS